MTTLIVVRHGQSESNLKQIFTGQGDTVLTELGHAQAEATAAYLDAYRIDRIYSSDLSRAMQTAEPTAARQGLSVISDPQLREIYAGLWENQPYVELMKRFPQSYDRWIHDIGRAYPEEGESVQQLAARVYAELDRLLEENRGRCIAFFTHATPMRMLACRWYGIDPMDAAQVPFCTNASVSVVEYEDDGSHRLVCYGYNAHQGSLISDFPKGIV